MDDLTKEFLAESLDGLDRMERALTELELRPEDSELLPEIFRTVHTIKGSTGFLGFPRLEALAHAGETLLGLLRDGSLEVDANLITVMLELLDRLRQIVGLIAQYGHEGVRREDRDHDLIALLAAAAERQPGSSSGVPSEEAKDQGSAALAPAAECSLAPAARREPEPDPVPAAAAPRSSAHDLRVPIEVLNRMMHLVGELVLTRNQVLELNHHSPALPAALSTRLDALTSDLRETVMEARLQPLTTLFGRLPRMVRDLARECGRQVRLECTGQETALDKSLLEAIRDPLTHAIRNAIDHGIEPPPLRRRAGKPEEGRLRLHACHSHGWVVVEIADDGRGIDAQHILALALERGLVSTERAASLTPQEQLELIFVPGFSTAAAVTSVSGRGVGMDVVRASIERVGGLVELESTPGCGTVLRLRVPLTLAILPAILVASGGVRFCLPQTALTELVHVARHAPVTHTQSVLPGGMRLIETVGEAQLYRLREELLPIVWLDSLLGLPPARQEHGFYLAVLDVAGSRFGLAVDELLAPEEIVVKPLSEVASRLGLFAGATMLGCGTLALILEAKAIAARAGIRPAEQAPAEPLPPLADPRQLYLVFTCSTARNAERHVLPLAGVERLEEISAEQVEQVRGRPVLRYRGQVLPLADPGNLLTHEQRPTCTLLVCQHASGSRSGLVVAQVLEVTDGTHLPAPDLADGPEGEALLVGDRLATLYSAWPSPSPSAALELEVRP